MTALTAILSSYPAGVVAKVCDPRTGIAGEVQFLPTIAEVRHACELEMKPMRDEEERQRRRAESDRILNGEPEPREKRKSFAELAAMYPDIVGTKVKRPPTDAEKAAALAMLESRRDYLRSPLAPSPRLAATNLVNQAILDAMTDDEDGNR